MIPKLQILFSSVLVIAYFTFQTSHILTRIYSNSCIGARFYHREFFYKHFWGWGVGWGVWGVGVGCGVWGVGVGWGGGGGWVGGGGGGGGQPNLWNIRGPKNDIQCTQK